MIYINQFKSFMKYKNQYKYKNIHKAMYKLLQYKIFMVDFNKDIQFKYKIDYNTKTHYFINVW